MRRAFSAVPTAAQMPWPSDPVATSTNDSRGVGWPSRSESSRAELQQSSRGKRPGVRPRRVEDRRGMSLREHEAIVVGFCGFFGSKRISPKNSVATISAADMQVVGWPLPASVVERIESMRSSVARFSSACDGCVSHFGSRVYHFGSRSERSRAARAGSARPADPAAPPAGPSPPASRRRGRRTRGHPVTAGNGAASARPRSWSRTACRRSRMRPIRVRSSAMLRSKNPPSRSSHIVLTA